VRRSADPIGGIIAKKGREKVDKQKREIECKRGKNLGRKGREE
jgi:hypothetical protein